MPYEIQRKSGGFFVCKGKRCFSKEPLTKKMAEKQRSAIYISEHRNDKKSS
jgi:hypothetical protein